MSLKIVHNTYSTEDKEIKLWAKAWMEKQRVKGKKKEVKQKPRA